MKAKDLIEKLNKLEFQDQDVMFQDPNSHGGPFSVLEVIVTKSKGQFPDDFQMPEGYKYILLKA